MRYANPDTLFFLLEIDPEDASAENVALMGMVEQLEEGVAQVIDTKCGRTFGLASSPVTRDVAYSMRDDGSWPIYTDRVLLPTGEWFFFTTPGSVYSSRPYILPYAVRNVTAVFVDGTWDGTVWDDEEEILAADWRLVYTRSDGWSHGLVLPYDTYGSVRVTGEWEDGSWDDEVPPDIREAATFLAADEWRTRMSSPNGEIGPPGLTTYLRNAWNFEVVKTAIENHRVQQVVV